MEFSDFCNICFKQENIIKMTTKECRKILNIMISLIGHPEMFNDVVYLCSYCCKKLEEINKFRAICVKNFIHFRQSYCEFKKKIEVDKDSGLKRKVKILFDPRLFKKRRVGETAIDLTGEDDDVKVNDTESVVIKEEPHEICENENSTDNEQNENNVYCNVEELTTERNNLEYRLHTEVDLGVTSFLADETDNSDDDSQQILQGSKVKKCHMCSVCREIFTEKSDLNRHKVMHTRENYKCLLCEKTFKQPDYLRIHMNQHTGNEPSKCEISKRKCSNSKNLQVDEVNHRKKGNRSNVVPN